MKEKTSVLKGNFETKKKVEPAKPDDSGKDGLAAKVKKQALASLGGSMVYMERKKRTWDGEQK